MTLRVDAPAAEERRTSPASRALGPALPAPQASTFAPAWSRARRRAGNASRDAARSPPHIACPANAASACASTTAALPPADALGSILLAPTPRAPASRHPSARDNVDRSLVSPGTRAPRRSVDEAHVAIATSREATTTIEPGWPGVRLVLRAWGSTWRLDWIGPRPIDIEARSLRSVVRRFRTHALGVLRVVVGGWLR